MSRNTIKWMIIILLIVGGVLFIGRITSSPPSSKTDRTDKVFSDLQEESVKAFEEMGDLFKEVGDELWEEAEKDVKFMQDCIPEYEELYPPEERSMSSFREFVKHKKEER